MERTQDSQIQDSDGASDVKTPQPEPHPQRRRSWLRILISATVVVIIGFFCIVSALRSVRPFYKSALEIPKEKLEQGSQDFLNRTSKFYNDIRKPGNWSVVWTDEQINGWLAIDQAINHPKALPSDAHDPRVQFKTELLSLGISVDRKPFPVVASFDANLKIAGSHKIALRILTVRVGTLPYGIDKLIQDLTNNMRDRGWGVEHTTIENDPVLILTMPDENPDDKIRINFDAIELREGELYLAGNTKKA